MDFRGLECGDVNWIQLMQSKSMVNMVMNVSVV
jgi:hypothetical protein